VLGINFYLFWIDFFWFRPKYAILIFALSLKCKKLSHFFNNCKHSATLKSSFCILQTHLYFGFKEFLAEKLFQKKRSRHVFVSPVRIELKVYI